MSNFITKTIVSIALVWIGCGTLFAKSQAVSDFAAKENITTSQVQVVGYTSFDRCDEYHITGTVTWDNFSYIVPTNIIIPPFKSIEAEQEEGANAEAAAFKLFPNPAQGQITFEYPCAEGVTVTVEIYNLAGQLLDHVTMTRNQQAYSTEHLANGIYFATLKADGKTVAKQKIVLIK